MNEEVKLMPSEFETKFAGEMGCVQDYRGIIAVELATKWGMVCGIPDGEDSSGRSKLRLMTPQEVVERATATAGLMADNLIARGWIKPASSPEARLRAAAALDDVRDELSNARYEKNEKARDGRCRALKNSLKQITNS